MLDLLEALAAIGVDLERACAAAGLDVARLREGESASCAQFLALLDDAERQTGDPCVGLRAGERSEPRGPLAYLLLSCAGLEHGLRQVARFASLTISTLSVEVAANGDRLRVVYDFGDERLARSRHAIDYMLMANLRSFWRAAGERFPLRALELPFADPGDDAEARAFDCAVSFGHERACWVIDARELRRAPPLANPLIAAQIEDFAAALFARLPVTAALRTRVADETRRLLASGVRADRAAVARRLGMSDRTLTRGLEEESTTFREVRDAVLWEVVEAMLSDPALKIEAIALSTGFADVAAFSKAFKRWSGRTPTEHRGRLLARETRA